MFRESESGRHFSFFVGLDVNSKFIVVCILNGDGKLHERHRVRRSEVLLGIVSRLPKFAVCFEASYGYGWLHDKLKPLAARLAGGRAE